MWPATTACARDREAVMRHDPAAAAITIMLRSLKMHGMAQAAAELTEQGAPAFQSAIPVLSQLLKAEIAEREVRSIAYQLKVARFLTYKDLAGFDFASSQLNEALVRQLHAGAFMEKADNIVLVGGPGTGNAAHSRTLHRRLAKPDRASCPARRRPSGHATGLRWRPAGPYSLR